MTERDLENLKSLPVPAARGSAKRAAMHAALEAFDAAAPDVRTDETYHSENLSEKDSQGNVVPLRQTETSVTKRRFPMTFSYRPSTAIAASLIAMAVVAPLAFQKFSHVGGKYGVPPMNGSKVSENATPASDGLVVLAEKAKREETGRDAAKSDPAQVTAEQKIAQLDKDNAPAKPAEPAPIGSGPATIARMKAKQPPNGVGAMDSAISPNQETTIASIPPPAAAPAAAAAKPSGGLAEGGVPVVPSPKPSIHDPGTTLGSNQQYIGSTSAELPKLAQDERQRLSSLDSKRLLARAEPEAMDAIALDGSRGAIELSANEAKSRYGWMGDQPSPIYVPQAQSGDKFDVQAPSPVKQVIAEPVSTFSLDVDTASYSFVRRALMNGQLPPRDAVRVEELINYFPYAYPAPESADTPFKPSVTVMPSPWNPSNKLVHVALKGYELAASQRPRANLVFLMDVSGSMEPADRLPLVKNAFKMLLDQLRPEDTVAIVTYAGNSGIALNPTPARNTREILYALDNLGAGGSTAGAAGLRDAYRLAEQNFEKNSVNRIILATDGDFNVGITDQNELKSFVEHKRESGIFLSILGVGQGNHNDALMQTLAQNGNGTASYVDTINEARKVLVDEAGSTLFTIAKDVKVQIEWNPAAVAAYRLIGYESRALKREDFNNDRVDAGDVGSGHTVTAIYEVTPVGAPQLADDLRYGKRAEAPVPGLTDTKPGELGFLKLRYKKPNEDTSQLLTLPIANDTSAVSLDRASSEVKFPVAVAAFGELLRNSTLVQRYTYDDVIALAQSARGDDPFGYRAEFINLVRLAKTARD